MTERLRRRAILGLAFGAVLAPALAPNAAGEPTKVFRLGMIVPSRPLPGTRAFEEQLREFEYAAFLPVAADGQALPFADGSFDAVICQLGLQFFPNPGLGLIEFRRVLRDGGRIAICVASTPDRVPLWGILAEVLGRLLPEQRHVVQLSFSLADKARLEQLFAASGFDGVRVERQQREGVLASFDEYWKSLAAGQGSIAQVCLMLLETKRNEVREEVRTRLAHFQSNEGLRMRFEMLIGSGRK